MKSAALILVVAGGVLLSACEFEGGDPVQHALRDAAAARQAAALKTTEEEEEAQAIRRATASGPALHEPDELSRLIAARRQAVQETRTALAAIADPALKAQLTEDLKAEEASLRALEARRATNVTGTGHPASH